MHPFFRQLIANTKTENIPNHLAVEVAAENLLNGKTRTYSPHSSIIQGLNHAFIPSGAIQMHQGLLRYTGNKRTFRLFGSKNQQGLLVHPNSITKQTLGNQSALRTLPATTHPFYALSSLRSVLYESDGKWYRGKLHLEDVKISRYFRNLGGRTIEHSVAVSDAIVSRWKEIQKHYQHPTALGFYEEFAGTVLANTPDPLPMESPLRDGEWGSLDRSLYPMGIHAEKMCAIPLFAFYGSRTDNTSNKTLGETMIRASGESPGDFIFSRIMAPVILAWIAVFETTGIIWEPHAQNMVFLFDTDSLEPKAVALRDADTAVSSSRRQQLGLSCETFFSANVHGETPTQELPRGDRSEISRVIDISMGRNTFDYLGNLYRDVFGGDPKELETRCKNLFQEVWPTYSRWLPSEVYGYKNSPLADNRNCYPLEAKLGVIPSWRPGV